MMNMYNTTHIAQEINVKPILFKSIKNIELLVFDY